MWFRYLLPVMCLTVLVSSIWIGQLIFHEEPFNVSDFFHDPAAFQAKLAKEPLYVHDHIINRKRINDFTLSGGCWDNVALQSVEFKKMVFDRVHFRDSVLTLVDFSDSVLLDTVFESVHIYGADTTDQYDYPRNFSGASLRNVTFRNAELSDVDFTKLKASQIRFINSSLSNVNFAGATVKLTFENTRLTDVDLDNLAEDSETIFVSKVS